MSVIHISYLINVLSNDQAELKIYARIREENE